MLDERARILLKALVERYIADGQPVGSRALSRVSGLELSPATIRNIMSDLEEMGFVASPHTSAGRIPTALGYRLFVDTLLKIEPLNPERISQLEGQLQPNDPSRLINQASSLLSELTRFAGVVVVPRRVAPKIRLVEFLSLSDKRILLILVSEDGTVQNRILVPDRSYSASELTTAANFLNQHYAGLDFPDMRRKLQDELTQLKSDMTSLMTAAIEAGNEAFSSTNSDYVISGEHHLLDAENLTSNMQRLRELFALFEQRTSLAQLMDMSQQADGVQIFIGSESGLAPLDECSVVTAPYESNGSIVGSVAVIGPTRMAYDRVIPIVDITAKLLSSALSNH